MHQESPWRLVVAVVVLVFFAGIGVASVISPDRFMRSSGIRKGGEMLNDWNRFGVRIAGAIFAIFAGYVLYDLLRS